MNFKRLDLIAKNKFVPTVRQDKAYLHQADYIFQPIEDGLYKPIKARPDNCVITSSYSKNVTYRSLEDIKAIVKEGRFKVCIVSPDNEYYVSLTNMDERTKEGANHE